MVVANVVKDIIVNKIRIVDCGPCAGGYIMCVVRERLKETDSLINLSQFIFY